MSFILDLLFSCEPPFPFYFLACSFLIAFLVSMKRLKMQQLRTNVIPRYLLRCPGLGKMGRLQSFYALAFPLKWWSFAKIMCFFVVFGRFNGSAAQAGRLQNNSGTCSAIFLSPSARRSIWRLQQHRRAEIVKLIIQIANWNGNHVTVKLAVAVPNPPGGTKTHQSPCKTPQNSAKSQQKVIKKSTKSNKKSTKSHQQVNKKLPKSQQKITKKSTKSHHKVSKNSPKSQQKVTNKLAKSHQQVNKKSLKNQQKVMKKLTKSNQKFNKKLQKGNKK